MQPNARLAVAVLTLFSCATAQVADGGADAAKCEAYVVPTTTDLTTPQVSFRNDVMPLFDQTCGFSSCHGSPASARVFLGLNPGTGDPAKVRPGIVGVMSKALPTMALVAASDPSKSFLLHKIDGDACTFKKECAGEDCGVSMPERSPLLDVKSRDTIRRWVAQGAGDN